MGWTLQVSIIIRGGPYCNKLSLSLSLLIMCLYNVTKECYMGWHIHVLVTIYKHFEYILLSTCALVNEALTSTFKHEHKSA